MDADVTFLERVKKREEERDLERFFFSEKFHPFLSEQLDDLEMSFKICFEFAAFGFR